MYQVYNTLTNAPEAVLSERPYELAGPLAERIIEQKKDEQGNLLYLSATEIMDDGGNPTGEFAETTETGYYIEVVDGYDEENQPTGFHQEFIPYTPVIIDAGAVYEWREVIPTPADIAAETQRALVAAVQNHLDSAARQYGYDDIKSAVTYAEEPAVPKFQAEGRAFRAWRSLIWEECYSIMEDVLLGNRQIPTIEVLLSELPTLEI